MKRFAIFILSALGFFALASCEDWLENELPDNQIPAEEALQSAEDMQNLLNSVYDVVANYSGGNMQRFSELLADGVDILGNSGFLVQVFNRSSDFFNSDVGGFYGQPYIAIFRANLILENLDQVEGLTEADRNRFEGEAKFIRAIAHFELVRLFAQPYGFTADNSHLGIPLKTAADKEPEFRSTVGEVYAQVLSDLTEAKDLLPVSNGNYATSWSAKAYLAKVYFQMNDFANAATEAMDVIDNGGFDLGIDPADRYSQQVSGESIFTIISTRQDDNRAGTYIGLFRSDIGAPTIRGSEDLLRFMNATANDARADLVTIRNEGQEGEYIGINKFNLNFMNISLTNLTEMKLIAAEAIAASGGDLAYAITQVNNVKGRAGVAEIPANSNASFIISEARDEYRSEFFGDGFRVHNLKRIAILEAPDLLIRSAPWNCNGMVLQFPASEISVDGFTLNPEGGCN